MNERRVCNSKRLREEFITELQKCPKKTIFLNHLETYFKPNESIQSIKNERFLEVLLRIIKQVNN